MQGKYIPETEEKERPQIEVSPQKVKIKLTEEQVAKREQMIEETKRRILGG